MFYEFKHMPIETLGYLDTKLMTKRAQECIKMSISDFFFAHCFSKGYRQAGLQDDYNANSSPSGISEMKKR